MPEEASFHDLIRRVRSGDRQAATDLVRRYEPAVRRAVRVWLVDARLRRAFDSVDICQSVLGSFFVRVSLGQYQLDRPEQLVNLLLAMARNKLADQTRHQQAECRDARREAGACSEQLIAAEASPSQQVAGEELLHEPAPRHCGNNWPGPSTAWPASWEWTSWAMIEAVPGWIDRLLAEQNQRWQHGDRAGVEAYLDQYPDLLGRDDAVLDLIYNEVFLRTRAGETPALEEYLQRFPRFAAELRVQFEIHQAFTPEPLLPPAPAPTPTANGTPAGARPAFRVPGYEILDELGKGGMGVVYRARQVALDRVVALKVLRAGAAAGERQRARLLREAQAVARLQHPNIVQIYEVSEVEGQPYCALEFVEGGSLADRLAGRPQPPTEAAALVEVLARAMHHAHERGVVHRDLKPANILLHLGNRDWGRGRAKKTETGGLLPVPVPDGSLIPHSPFATPKITDFGLAMRLDVEVSQTQRGAIMGTAGYMAPEQARGDTEAIGPASDVYGLGAILYEMLTGRPPFLPAATLLATVLQIETKEPERPSRLQARVPADLEAVCLRALAKRPQDRYPSAAALADDLHRFLVGRTVSARVPPLPERLARWARRGLVPLAGAVGVLALLAVLAVTLGGRNANRPETEEPAPAAPLPEVDSRARFHGTIIAIRGDRLTIALGTHPRKNPNPKTFKTFKLHAGTRFEAVGRPGTSGPQPAELADLPRGASVTIQAAGEGAARADVVTFDVNPSAGHPAGE